MTRPPLRTILVGMGRIGAGYADDPLVRRHFEFATHAQVLEAHPAFAWDAVVDPSESARQEAKERWGVRHTAADLDSLPRTYEPQVAVIATPPDVRLAVVSRLPALKGVMVEKPLGRSPAEGTAFVEHCGARGLPVQVDLWRRGDSALASLAAGRLRDLIGRPQAAFGLYGNGLLNNGTHMVDLVRFLMGDVEGWWPFEGGRSHAAGPITGDLNVGCQLRLPDSVIVTLQDIGFEHYRENSLDIWGERGRLAIMHEGLYITAYPRRPHRALQDAQEIACDDPTVIASGAGRALYRLYDDLASAIWRSTPLLSPAASALRSEAIVHSILDAVRTDHSPNALGGPSASPSAARASRPKMS